MSNIGLHRTCSARRSVILLPNFPRWGGALSNWRCILLCSHIGHLPKNARKRFSIILLSVSFCPTNTDFVLRVPAGLFFDVCCAGTCLTNQVPIVPSHQHDPDREPGANRPIPPAWSWQGCALAIKQITFLLWFLCLHEQSGGTSPGTMKLVTFWER